MKESIKLSQKGHNVKICREDFNSYHDGIHMSKMSIRNIEHTKMAKKKKYQTLELKIVTSNAVFPSLLECSTVCYDPHSQRL